MIDRDTLIAKIRFNIKRLNSLVPDPDPVQGVVVNYGQSLSEMKSDLRNEFAEYNKKPHW